MENHFLTTYQKAAKTKAPAWLKSLQDKNLARFETLGIPDRKNEEWKYTNAKKIVETPFELAPETEFEVPQDILDYIRKPELALVFVNGHFWSTHSNFSKLPAGVTVTTLAQAMDSHADVLKSLLADEANTDQPFSALNAAFLKDGVFVHVSKGAIVRDTLHIVYLAAPIKHGNGVTSSDQPKFMSHPRTVIVLEPNSEARVLESHVSFSDLTYFSNAVTNLTLKAGAKLVYQRVQNESLNASHVGATHVTQGRDSRFESFVFSAGGKIARHSLDIQLKEEGATTKFDGLYLAGADQHVDHQTLVNHLRPNCASHQFYKGILAGKARGVFAGRIDVHPAAQQTDAQQTNKNLLLSKTAEIDTKPQLNIGADDVKCSHGATVGQLNEEEIFYFQSRAIPREAATRMLVQGFAEDAILQIEDTVIREKLLGLLQKKLGELTK